MIGFILKEINVKHFTFKNIHYGIVVEDKVFQTYKAIFLNHPPCGITVNELSSYTKELEKMNIT